MTSITKITFSLTEEERDEFIDMLKSVYFDEYFLSSKSYKPNLNLPIKRGLKIAIGSAFEIALHRLDKSISDLNILQLISACLPSSPACRPLMPKLDPQLVEELNTEVEALREFVTNHWNDIQLGSQFNWSVNGINLEYDLICNNWLLELKWSDYRIGYSTIIQVLSYFIKYRFIEKRDEFGAVDSIGYINLRYNSIHVISIKELPIDAFKFCLSKVFNKSLDDLPELRSYLCSL